MTKTNAFIREPPPSLLPLPRGEEGKLMSKEKTKPRLVEFSDEVRGGGGRWALIGQYEGCMRGGSKQIQGHRRFAEWIENVR